MKWESHASTNGTAAIKMHRLRNRYPQIRMDLTDANKQVPIIDNLYLDFNGIIYRCLSVCFILYCRIINASSRINLIPSASRKFINESINTCCWLFKKYTHKNWYLLVLMVLHPEPKLINLGIVVSEPLKIDKN